MGGGENGWGITNGHRPVSLALANASIRGRITPDSGTVSVMSEPTGDILCSRCGTPFPRERGKVTVTCVVCGQLRPDLDMTLEDEDGDGTGTATSGPHAMSQTPPLRVSRGGGEMGTPAVPPPPAAGLPPAKPAPRPAPRAAYSPAPPPPPISSSRKGDGDDFGLDFDEIAQMPETSGGFFEQIGPVVMVIPTLISALISGLLVLDLPAEFTPGAWYAAGTVALIVAIFTLFAGLCLVGVIWLCRLRNGLLLQIVFVLCAAAVCFTAAKQIPSRVIIRNHDLPAFYLK